MANSHSANAMQNSQTLTTAAAMVSDSQPQLQAQQHCQLQFPPQSQPGPQSYGTLAPQSATNLSWPPFLVGQVARPVRVLLVDDDTNIRHVISSELMADLRCDLVGQGGSMREGRRLISGCEFDVMLVDLNLGDGNGF